MYQKSLLQISNEAKEPSFPPTKFMGSKQNLVNFIFEKISDLEYDTVFDAFSGSGVVAYEFKKRKKQVTTNDFLHFSYLTSKALIENNNNVLDDSTLEKLLEHRTDAPQFVRSLYSNRFFKEDECIFLDSLWKNIQELKNEYDRAIAIGAACRACQKKRPRGIFTVIGQKGWDGRKDLKLSLQEQFINAVFLFNRAIFDNGRKNTAIWSDILKVNDQSFDLVYLDPPYWSPLSDNDYVRRYHFIEGYSLYWNNLTIDMKTKSKKFKSYNSSFSNRESSIQALKLLFEKYHKSIIVVSYASNSYPTKQEMVSLLEKTKQHVSVFEVSHRYSFANQTNINRKNSVKEYVFIGSD
jgi:DNA adenine methylase